MSDTWKKRSSCSVFGGLLSALMLATAPIQAQGVSSPLKVAATVPELGSLVREVGGDQVAVTVFAKGTEIRTLLRRSPATSECSVKLTCSARPAWKTKWGGRRYSSGMRVIRVSCLAPRAILTPRRRSRPLEVPTGTMDRSMGDVHAAGNPHYLTDPLNGLRVAALVRDKLIELRPDSRPSFQQRYQTFRQRLATAMVGETLAQKYDVEKLALLFEYGKLADFLKQQGDEGSLGGWLGMMLPYYGTKVAADHNAWPYFARRFGIVIVGFLEPKPGIPPTTKHLGELVNTMQAEQVKLVIGVPYYDPRHAQFISQHTGARIVTMAHQVGARPGTDDYISMIDYNVRSLVAALRGGR